MLQSGFSNILSQIAKSFPALNSLPPISKGMIPPTGDPTLQQDENQKFGNWTGGTDTKIKAKDLMRRGLIGADQMFNEDQSNLKSGSQIRNAQSDWKIAAIQNILSNAKKFGITKPEEVLANKNVLIGNERWVDAINNQSFKNIHPNFWNIITDSLLPEQYAKYNKQNSNNIAKK